MREKLLVSKSCLQELHRSSHSDMGVLSTQRFLFALLTRHSLFSFVGGISSLGSGLECCCAKKNHIQVIIFLLLFSPRCHKCRGPSRGRRRGGSSRVPAASVSRRRRRRRNGKFGNANSSFPEASGSAPDRFRKVPRRAGGSQRREAGRFTF